MFSETELGNHLMVVLTLDFLQCKTPPFICYHCIASIGVGKGGAEGAKAPPTLKLEGLSPPNFMLDGRLVVVKTSHDLDS